MKLIDITLALVITSNVIISCHSAATLVYKRTDIHPQKLSLSDRKHMFSKNDLLEGHHHNRSSEFIKKPRRELLLKWNIQPIQIKLDIVVDKYRHRSKDIEKLYRGMIGCGVSGCQTFNNYIPKPKHNPDANYFKKRRRHLRKKVHQLLETFHDGLRKIHGSYDDMLKFENSTLLHNKLRAELLTTLEKDIAQLNFEVEAELKKGKRAIIFNKEAKKEFTFPYPSNQTDLLIQEWYVIQGSKRFLTEWQKILNDLMTQTRRLAYSQRRRLKKLEKSTPKPRRKGLMRAKKKNLTTAQS